jgi:hypothetical protein
MPPCLHRNLLLLPAPAPRRRCRHCHLTIREDELDGGFCPECYERSGRRRYDFETLDGEDGGARYRCEECGILVAGG